MKTTKKEIDEILTDDEEGLNLNDDFDESDIFDEDDAA